MVFVQLGELAKESCSFLVDGKALHECCGAQGLTDDAVIKAIHAIAGRGLINEARQFGSRIRFVRLRPRMLREYVALRTDVAALERRLIAEIVNRREDPRPELGAIAARVDVERVVAQAVLEGVNRRLYTLSERLGGAIYIDGISPLLALELEL